MLLSLSWLDNVDLVEALLVHLEKMFDQQLSFLNLYVQELDVFFAAGDGVVSDGSVHVLEVLALSVGRIDKLRVPRLPREPVRDHGLSLVAISVTREHVQVLVHLIGDRVLQLDSCILAAREDRIEVNIEQILSLLLDGLAAVFSSHCLGLLRFHRLWAALNSLSAEIRFDLILLNPLEHLATLHVAQRPALEMFLFSQELLYLLLETMNYFQYKKLFDGQGLECDGLVFFFA